MTIRENIPTAIGIIMDGNRRYAKEHNMPKLEGHRRGYDKLKEVVEWCKESGVKYLTVYAFSTENWNRSADEVDYLMNLIRTLIDKETKQAMKEHTRLLFPGDRSRFATDIQEGLTRSEEATKGFTDFTLSVALSYGGRAEIIDAIRRIPDGVQKTITEKDFARLLWTGDVPDPDLIIRTSGEMRLSGFLPWQSVYSEFYFTPTLWPAFTKEEFTKALRNYAARDRRKGK